MTSMPKWKAWVLIKPMTMIRPRAMRRFSKAPLLIATQKTRCARILDEPAQVDSKGMLDDFRAVGAAGDAKIPDEEGGAVINPGHKQNICRQDK